MLAYVLTQVVTDILLTYGEYSNVPEEFRPIYNMKNEFLKRLETLNLFNCWKLFCKDNQQRSQYGTFNDYRKCNIEEISI